MRLGLTVLFGLILAAMLYQTTQASLYQALWEIPGEVGLHPWFIATLFDAYFGFITFYCWVFYRERSALSRVVWFILLMLLGNIAIAIYCLNVLRAASPNATFKDLLLRPEDRTPEQAHG
jgi:predicted permease